MVSRKTYFAALAVVAIFICGAATSMIDYRTGIRNVPVLTDAGQPSLDAACRSAGTALLAVTQKWTVQTMACAANLIFSGGSIQPGRGQKITLSGSISGDLTQHFDTSMSGPGSILLTRPVPALYPNWFGAIMDGKADDLPAWQSAIAAVASTGGNVQMPANVASRVSGTIVLPLGRPLVIAGAGRTSAILCTGIPCIRLNSAGQGLESLEVSDPVGNASTVGIWVDDGIVPCCQMANQIHFRNVTVTGNGSNEMGVGIKINNAINVHLDQVTESYFGIGLLTTGASNALRIDRSNLLRNMSRGWDIESSGDMSAAQSDFEANGSQGVYLGLPSNNITINSSHFEDNKSDQFEILSGQLVGLGNTYSGGSIRIDSAGTFASYNEQLSGVTLVNDASGGGTGQPGAVFFYPLLGPTVSGKGWTQSFTRLGLAQINSPAVYGFTGAGSYSFDQPVKSLLFPSPGVAASVICNGATSGMMRVITDSTVTAWGAAVLGGGGTSVLAFCNGNQWTVAGK